MSYEDDREFGMHKQGGTTRAKYSSIRVPERACSESGWHVGQYVFGPRLGKVIAINGTGAHRSVVFEHPYEPLPRQDFPEWRMMRQFDRVAEETHGSPYRNIRE